MKYLQYALFAVSLISFSNFAQNLTLEDYNRAVSYTYGNSYNKRVFNLSTDVNWFKDNLGIWFIDYSKEGKTYKNVSFKNYTVTTLFNHVKLANALSEFSQKEVESNNLSLSNIEFEDGENLSFEALGKVYILNLNSYELQLKRKKKKEPKNEFESKSPNGKWVAYTENYNLFIKSAETEEEYQLSFDGKKNFDRSL